MFRFDGNMLDPEREPLPGSSFQISNSGNNRISDYTREDYASLQKAEEYEADKYQLEGRPDGFLSNSTDLSRKTDAGYRALYSLQLCNNENVVKSLMNEMFSIGVDGKTGDIEVNTQGEASEPLTVDTKDFISRNNLAYNLDKDQSITLDQTGTVLDPPESGVYPYRPRVGPAMASVGDAIFLDNSNSQYLREKTQVKDSWEDFLDDPTALPWSVIQQIVRSGKASQIYSISDPAKNTLHCKRNGVDLEWRIIGFDMETPSDESKTHSMTLQLITPIQSLAFSRRYIDFQNLFYFPDGLRFGESGTSDDNKFYFYVDSGAGGDPSDAGSYFGFELSQEIPADSKATLLISSSNENASLAGQTLRFKTDSGTVLEDAILQQYSSAPSGESIGSITSSPHGEPSSYWTSTVAINNLFNANVGTSCYARSPIYYYLNGSLSEDVLPLEFLELQEFDPSGLPVFADGLDSDFLSCVGEVTVKTSYTSAYSPTYPDKPYYELNNKFFLLSVNQIFGNTQDGDDGRYYSVAFPDASSRIRLGSGGNAVQWWTRNGQMSTLSHARDVNSNGARSGRHIRTLELILPCCCIV